MNATFRPAFKYLMYGGLLLLSGLAMFVLSVAHWAGYQLSDVNDRTARLTALLGVAGLGFGGLLTSISQMTRFTIAGETIAVRRPLSVCQFDIGEIRRIIWKLGQPRFELSLASTKLDLSLYSNDEQLAIIRAIRTLVPESVQDNWAEFCHRRALPLREGGGRDRWLMSLPASTRFFSDAQTMGSHFHRPASMERRCRGGVVDIRSDLASSCIANLRLCVLAADSLCHSQRWLLAAAGVRNKGNSRDVYRSAVCACHNPITEKYGVDRFHGTDDRHHCGSHRGGCHCSASHNCAPNGQTTVQFGPNRAD
jgi:hypothetical protein